KEGYKSRIANQNLILEQCLKMEQHLVHSNYRTTTISVKSSWIKRMALALLHFRTQEAVTLL
ncbi:hypothetical protein, partial [Brevibacillus parabrevis]|uniref:hypothetical protein n=1 Tax=Brevibacillus parabrevis TaxID=54914 RepID=UPI000B277C9D